MTTAAMSKVTQPAGLPDMKVSVRQVFGIDTDLEVPAYSEVDPHVPDVDSDYRFDRATTLAILAGFAHNRRVMVTGYHGTGKSTHIEQVAARLNWPCVRVNLDSHISRIDLVGKDSIVVRDGKQVTEFRDGILPWALQHNIALVFDEYDAGRPDVMFVIQRVLEVSGRLTLLDQNKVIKPHPAFRLFSTANTVGLGDTSGLYHGTQQINQGQMDRWSIVTTLNYLAHDEEVEIVLAKAQALPHAGRPRHRQQDGAARRSHPQRVCQWRSLDGDEPAHGDHLGRERRHLQRYRLCVPRHLPQQVRRTGAAAGGRILPALLQCGAAREFGERGAQLAMARIAVERTIGKTKKAVLGGLLGYNAEKMGKQKYKRFAISLRQGDKIVGGIVGEVWTTVLFIQFFWMEQKLRGKDYGTRLIKAIEDEARKFGATRSYLDTMSFQAPGFYRACGYEEFGSIEGYPGGVTRHWFTKAL